MTNMARRPSRCTSSSKRRYYTKETPTITHMYRRAVNTCPPNKAHQPHIARGWPSQSDDNNGRWTKSQSLHETNNQTRMPRRGTHSIYSSKQHPISDRATTVRPRHSRNRKNTIQWHSKWNIPTTARYPRQHGTNHTIIGMPNYDQKPTPNPHQRTP